jgi:hypothetical protein
MVAPTSHQLCSTPVLRHNSIGGVLDGLTAPSRPRGGARVTRPTQYPVGAIAYNSSWRFIAYTSAS